MVYVYTYRCGTRTSPAALWLALMLNSSSDGSLVCWALLLMLDFSFWFVLSQWLMALTAPNKLCIPRGQISSDIPEPVWSERYPLLTTYRGRENLRTEEFNKREYKSFCQAVNGLVLVWPRWEFGRQRSHLFWSDEHNISAVVRISVQVINRWPLSQIT